MYRCGRCGIESPERSCFVFLRRAGTDPAKSAKCLQCVIARMNSNGGLGGVLTAMATLVSPLLFMNMGGWSGDDHVSLSLKIALACLMYPTALIIHELAHAVTGWLVGLEVGGITFGYGRSVWRFQLGAVQIRLNALPLSGRVYLGCEKQRFPRARVWLATLMGPLSNVLLVWIAAHWWHSAAPVVGTPVVAAWIMVNLIIAITNLMPYSGAGAGGNPYQSDGLSLLKIPRVPDSQLAVYRISALLVRGLSRYELGDLEGAQVWLEKAMQRVPDNPHVILALGASKISLGQYAEGRALLAPWLDRADLTIGMRASLISNIAYAMLITNAGVGGDAGELARADQLTAEIMVPFPCLLGFRTIRALLLAATQRPEEALSLLDYVNYSAGTVLQSAWRELARALSLHKLGRAEEAQKAAALALRLKPDIRDEMQLLGIEPPSAETQLRLLGAPELASFAWLRGIPSHLKEEVRQASESFDQPRRLEGANSALARIAGAILAVFGGGMGAGLLLLIYRLAMTSDDLDRTALIVMAGLLGLAAFCLSLGYRLVLNRPNRHGSLLSPWAWRVMGGGFLILTLLLGKLMLFRTPPAPNFAILLAPLLFAGGCWIAARGAERSRA
jgi:tetratricopeptide (TPR) repeat protein